MDELELPECTDGIVTIRNAVKSYSDGVNVLDNLTMTVPRGTIYGLLGPSGCGKTTLLTCILGRRKLNSGSVSVLGVTPGSGAGVPGPILGFMPQDCCLIEELSIEETANQYGALYGMKPDEINANFTFLHKLLELPKKSRRFGQLSGGQQRRVSLMVALLHSPTLLVLDEPTVGLDPVLRTKVWDYLVQLSNVHNTTIIVTTHYVEEARRAHNISLMRRGKLLCEGGPESLLNEFECTRIEELFIRLSIDQDSYEINPQAQTLVSRKPNELCTTPQKLQTNCHSFLYKQKSLLVKNILQYIRNPIYIYFTLGLCLQQNLLFYYAVIANNYGEFNVGVVNNEGACIMGDLNYTGMASCQYIQFLEDTEVKLKMVYFDSEEEARECVVQTRCMLTMTFPVNFTKALYERFWYLSEANASNFHESEIIFHEDTTLGLNWFFIRNAIYSKYLEFIEVFLTERGISSKLGRIPMRFGPSFRVPPSQELKKDGILTFNFNFVSAVLIFQLLASGIVLASVVINVEIKTGIWDRLLTTGVTTSEIFTSHVITQCFFALIQVIECVVIVVYCMNVPFYGGMWAYVVTNILGSLLGVALGFLTSSIFWDIRICMFACVGLISSAMFLIGNTWPLEGMPRLMYHIVYNLPLNNINRAVQYIILWDLKLLSGKVIKECTLAFVEIVAIFLISAFALKMRKKYDS